MDLAPKSALTRLLENLYRTLAEKLFRNIHIWAIFLGLRKDTQVHYQNLGFVKANGVCRRVMDSKGSARIPQSLSLFCRWGFWINHKLLFCSYIRMVVWREIIIIVMPEEHCTITRAESIEKCVWCVLKHTFRNVWICTTFRKVVYMCTRTAFAQTWEINRFCISLFGVDQRHSCVKYMILSFTRDTMEILRRSWACTNLSVAMVKNTFSFIELCLET